MHSPRNDDQTISASENLKIKKGENINLSDDLENSINGAMTHSD